MVRRQNFKYQNDPRSPEDSRTQEEIVRAEEEYVFGDDGSCKSKPSDTEDFEPSPTGGDNDDDDVDLSEDDFDEDFNPEVPGAASRRGGGKKRASPRKSTKKATSAKPQGRQVQHHASSSDGYEEPNASDAEESSEEEEREEPSAAKGRGRPRKQAVAKPTPAAKKKPPAKSKPKPKTTATKYYIGKDDSSFEDDDDSSDGDDDGSVYEPKSNAKDEDDDLEIDDNDDEEEYRPTKKKKKPPSRRKTSTAAKRGRGRSRKKLDDSDTDSSSDEDYNPRQQQPKKNKSSPKKRGRPEKKASSPQYSESSDAEDVLAPKQKRSRPKKMAIHPSDDEEVDEFDLDDDDKAVVASARKSGGNASRYGGASARRQPRRSKATQDVFDESSDEDAKDSNANRSSRRPSRFSATQAINRLSKLSQDDSDNEDDDPAPTPMKATTSRKRKSVLSSDEEFLADSASEPSNEKAEFDSDSDADGIGDDEVSEDNNVHQSRSKVRAAFNIDNEEVGTAESSSDESDKHQPTARANKEEILPENSQVTHNSDSSDNSQLDRAFTGAKEPRMPNCPSTEDCITAEELPRRHVCCISPDGSSRQCFTLETLRTVALKSNVLHIRHDLDQDRMTFLQPPHFRTKMSDDLLDQIASRFGREALDLHGEYYNRKPLNRSNISEEDNSYDILDDDEEFLGRVQRYIDSQMGSQDVYACPLCYSEMHRRVCKGYRIKSAGEDTSDADDEEERKRIPTENVHDPMLILGWLDNEKFEGASAFCFKRVAEVKQHLRNDHNVDTRGIQGNDLYFRFKVRAPDGLLQRWLKQARKGSSSFQGDMRRYWNEGNNQSFIHLLDMIKKADFYSGVLNDSDASEEEREAAEDYFSISRNFFAKFIDRAKEEWNSISSPFRKATKDDLKGFVVADGDVEDDGESDDDNVGGPPPAYLAHLKASEESDENDLIHKLQRKYAEGNNGNESHSESELSDDQNLHSDDDLAKVYSDASDINGYYSEVEEEKDEWIAGLQKKRKSKGGSGFAAVAAASANDELRTPSQAGKKLTKRRHSHSLATPASAASQVTPASKRRSIREDSDED